MSLFPRPIVATLLLTSAWYPQPAIASETTSASATESAEAAQVAIDEANAPSAIGAARVLAYEGQEAYDAGRYEQAAEAAQAAQRLVPAPTLALLEARSLKKLDRWLEARTQYRIAAAPLARPASDAFQRARQAAVGELLMLEGELPRLSVQLRNPHVKLDEARVTVDGARWPSASLGIWVPQDPGEHVVEIEIGATRERQVVRLEPRARHRLLLGAPEGESNGSSLRTPLAISAFALGAIGLGAGIGFGVQAENLRATLDSACPGGTCPAEQAGLLNDYRTARDVSTAGYVVGATGAVAGGIVLLALPSSGTKDGAALTLGPGRLDLAGMF